MKSPPGRRRGTAGDGEQIGHMAAVERHFADFFFVDSLLEGDVFGLQSEAGRGDLNVGGFGTDRHFGVDVDAAADFEDVALLGVGGEAGDLDGDGVGADGEVGNGVVTTGGGGGVIGDLGLLVDDSDGRTGKDGAGGIGD